MDDSKGDVFIWAIVILPSVKDVVDPIISGKSQANGTLRTAFDVLKVMDVPGSEVGDRSFFFAFNKASTSDNRLQAPKVLISKGTLSWSARGVGHLRWQGSCCRRPHGLIRGWIGFPLRMQRKRLRKDLY